MTSETKLTEQQRLELADEANRMLENPLFKGIMNEIVRDAMNSLLKSTPGSPEAARIHASLLGADEFKGRLVSLRNDGAVIRDRHKKRGGTAY